MIGYLDGRVRELQPSVLLLDVGGVGYEIHVPLSLLPHAARGAPLGLFVHTHVREDALTLFGFLSARERDTFRALLAVSGVGPRTALALLSGLEPDELAAAIDAEQWRRLSAVPGIGRRTAERIIVELKGKLARPERAGAASPRADAISALVNLGYPRRAAEEAIGELAHGGEGLELGELIRQALRRLVR
jgi:Holliday junction DNA helicase RuvA